MNKMKGKCKIFESQHVSSNGQGFLSCPSYQLLCSWSTALKKINTNLLSEITLYMIYTYNYT